MYKRSKTPKDLKTKNKAEAHKDIMDFFVFDENENNIIIDPNKIKNKKNEENDKENKIKVNYNIISYITSFKRPDLYSPFGIISGNKYKLKRYLEEDKNKKDKDSSSSSEEKECNEKNKKMNIDINRYYYLGHDITIKCDICGQVGHRKDTCLNYNLKFCHVCLSSSHEDINCDKVVKCFRCNKLGHKAPYCPYKLNELIKCERCKGANHIGKECIMKPMEYSLKLLKRNKLKCFICGNPKHALCSLSKRELPEIIREDYNYIYKDLIPDYKSNGENIPLNEIDNNENENKNKSKNGKKKKKKKRKKKIKKIFEDLNNEDIKYTIFCSLCGGRHRYEECKQYNYVKTKNNIRGKSKQRSKSLLLKKRYWNGNNNISISNENINGNNNVINNGNFW